MTIKEYCIRISNLLEESGETEWANSFKNFVITLDTSEDHSAYKKIINSYGGAGSFNDLVLYKEGVLCIEENNDLSKLRAGLHKEVTNKWD